MGEEVQGPEIISCTIAPPCGEDESQQQRAEGEVSGLKNGNVYKNCAITLEVNTSCIQTHLVVVVQPYSHRICDAHAQLEIKYPDNLLS